MDIRKQKYGKPFHFVIAYEMIGDIEQELEWFDTSMMYKDYDVIYSKNGFLSEELKSSADLKNCKEDVGFGK